MEEGRIVEVADALKVRKNLAAVSLSALNKLATELNMCKFVTEDWAKNFKVIADQIRRDYHVPKEVKAAVPEQPPDEVPQSDDPFENLKIVSEEEEAA